MRYYLFIGITALLIALFLIFGRVTLAGKTITQGDVSITDRDEVWEQRLYVIGGVLGGLGIVVIFAGVAGTKTVKSRDVPR